MRKVIYSESSYAQEAIKDEGTGVILPQSVRRMREQGEALFHEFVARVLEDGTSITIAIIELEDGTVKNIPVEQIRFISGEIDK